jgi:adenosylmethionine-8-amino-7-oxononanoate aminotransferase
MPIEAQHAAAPRLPERDTVLHSHLLSCAAGVAALESYLEEDLSERSRKLGAAMLVELKRMQRRHATIGEPPLVIRERELTGTLALVDRLLGELIIAVGGTRS